MLSTLSSLLPSNIALRSENATPLGNGNRTLVSPENQPQNAVSDSKHTSASSLASKSVTDEPSALDELGMKKRSTASKVPVNETFIVVRPPPAKSNHPLNLQLQLVPPTAPRTASAASTASTGRASMESTRPSIDGLPPASLPSHPAPPSRQSTLGGEEASASRQPTKRRSVTDISLYNTFSTSSLASTYSSASSASSLGARRIVPLYNLHAHNVLQNTVLDAGTDVKVSKFTKRGLEILDLSFLEVMEVWGSPLAPLDMAASASKRNSLLTDPCSPNTAQLGKRGSISSFNSSSTRDENTRPDGMTGRPTAADYHETPKRAKKLFGKFFNKKVSDSPRTLDTPAEDPVTPTASRPDVSLQSPPPHIAITPDPSSPKSAAGPTLCPPVLDLQAVLIRSSPNARRPSAYIWIMKRWLKKGKIEGLKGMISAAGDKMSNFNIANLSFSSETAMEEVELRFEWVRNPKGKNKKRGSRRGSHNVQEQGSANDLKAAAAAAAGNGEQSLRSTTPEGTTRSSPERQSLSNVSQGGSAVDPGEDSDPEDSENPWTCTMSIRQIRNQHQSHGLSFHLPGFSPAHSPASSGFLNRPNSPNNPGGHLNLRPSSSSGVASPQFGHSRTASVPATSSQQLQPARMDPTKIKVATMFPAPHHPKIVAQLKVPYPLPDVDITTCMVHKRQNGQPGVNRDQPSVLTAEEIKDVVCSTGFWLVVREGFGGVGKERRKGDGWRIRA